MESSCGVTEFQSDGENSTIWKWSTAYVAAPIASAEDDDEEEGGGVDMVTSVVLGFVLAIFIVLTIAGNAMVLHAVRTDRKLQTVCNMFIVSLAIADLIVGLVVMPISAIYIFTDDWVFGVALCQFWIGVDYTASTASILNLFVLSVDRYWSVTNPLKYLRKRTRGRGYVMISMVWVVSSLWIVPIVGWHHFVNSGDRVVPSNVCDTEYATNTSLKIITSILNFYLPLAVMYALYSKIFIEIRLRSKLEVGQRVHFTAGRSVSIESLPRGDSDDAAGSYVDYVQVSDHGIPGRKSESLRSSSGRLALFLKRRRTMVRLPVSGGSTLNRGFVELTACDKTRRSAAEYADGDDVIMALDTMGVAGQPEVQAPPVVVAGDGLDRDVNGSRNPYFLTADKGSSPVKRKLKRFDSGVCLGLGNPNVRGSDDMNGGNSGIRKTKADETTTTSFSRSLFREISAWVRRDGAEQKMAVDSPATTHGRELIVHGTIHRATPNVKYQSLPVLYKNEHPVSPTRPRPEASAGDDVTSGVRFRVGQLSSKSSSGDAAAADDDKRRETRFPQEMHPSKNHVIRRHLHLARFTVNSQNPSDHRPLPVVSNPQPDDQQQQHPVHVTHRHFDSDRRSSSRDQQRHLESAYLDVRRSEVCASTVSPKQPSRRLRRRRGQGGPSSALQKEIKAARQLGVIMGAFTVCFLPYFVCFTVVAFCDWCVGGQLMTAVTWVGYLNSAMNPFLYPLCNVSFRRKFRQMLNVAPMRQKLHDLCCHRHRHAPPPPPPRVHGNCSLSRHSNLNDDPNNTPN